MGGLANTIFSVLLGWIRNMVSLVWGFFSKPQSSSTVAWFTRSWWAVAIVVMLVGTVLDVLVYWLRWRPDKVWISFFRRVGLLPQPKEEETEPRGFHPQTRRAVRQPVTEVLPQPSEPNEVLPNPYELPPVYTPAESALPPQTPNPYELPPAYTMPAEQAPAVNPYPRVSVGNPYAMPQTYAPPQAPAAPAEIAYQPMAQDAAAPMPEQEKPPKDRMGWVRRGLKELPRQLAMAGEDDQGIHYQPVQPTIRKEEAYRAPVYPQRKAIAAPHTDSTAPQETITAPKAVLKAIEQPTGDVPRRRRRAQHREGEN